MKPKILITGISGMIGYHLARELMKLEYPVIGIDNFNNVVYDEGIKNTRTRILDAAMLSQQYKYRGIDLATFNTLDNGGFHVENVDLKTADMSHLIKDFYNFNNYDIVVHLAALTNPRQSLEKSVEYIDNNIVGTQNLIAACENAGVTTAIHASTSCVMHGQETPWKEDSPVFHQNNPYGYSKWVNECQFKSSNINRVYSLRFFTAYGTFGRPDMAVWKFTDAIMTGKNVNVHSLFKSGPTCGFSRDFTHVSDTVQGIIKVIEKSHETPIDVEERSREVLNISAGGKFDVLELVCYLEEIIGKKANINRIAPHPADTITTHANIDFIKSYGYEPKVDLKDGLKEFVDWFKWYKHYE